MGSPVQRAEISENYTNRDKTDKHGARPMPSRREAFDAFDFPFSLRTRTGKSQGLRAQAIGEVWETEGAGMVAVHVRLNVIPRRCPRRRFESPARRSCPPRPTGRGTSFPAGFAKPYADLASPPLDDESPDDELSLDEELDSLELDELDVDSDVFSFLAPLPELRLSVL